MFSAQSIVCPQVKSAWSQLFPLWIITYWLAINHVQVNQRAWLLADQNLQLLHRGAMPIREAVNLTYKALSHLPWSGSVHSFTEKKDTIHLHKYATKAWFTTTNEAQMLHLLRQDLVENQKGVVIVTMEFIHGLFKASSEGKSLRKKLIHLTGQSS
jgi:hypothetical protein